MPKCIADETNNFQTICSSTNTKRNSISLHLIRFSLSSLLNISIKKTELDQTQCVISNHPKKREEQLKKLCFFLYIVSFPRTYNPNSIRQLSTTISFIRWWCWWWKKKLTKTNESENELGREPRTVFCLVFFSSVFFFLF